MYVEFFGLPGSGKTTLATALTEHEGVLRIGVQASYRDTLYFALRHPFETIWWFYLICRESVRGGTWSLFRSKLSMVGLAFARVTKARRADGVAIVDEGLLQRVLSIFETELDDRMAKRVLRHFSLGDVVIFLEGSESFHKRLIKRSNARVLLGRKYLKQWEKVAIHNAGVMVNALQQQGRPFISVSASDSPERVYEVIQQEMRKKKQT